jgi:hypothetical protein
MFGDLRAHSPRRSPVRSIALGIALAFAASVLAARAGVPIPPKKSTAAAPKASSAAERSWQPVASAGGGEEPTPPSRPDEVFPWDDIPFYGESSEPVRRGPAPVPPGCPLPIFPPAAAPPGTAVTSPPDFLGSAAGYLEIPVGQTATIVASNIISASPRDPKIARVLEYHADHILVRGLFPGQTLLNVRNEYSQREVYLIRVR